jgi:cyclohexanecarboxyl-CoA dehydrogenase
VTFPLVEGDSQIAAIRQLCYHAIALRDADKPHTAEAAMVKWMGPKTAFDVIHQCLLTFGHYGWTMDSPHQTTHARRHGVGDRRRRRGNMKLIVAREPVGRVAVQYGKR